MSRRLLYSEYQHSACILSRTALVAQTIDMHELTLSYSLYWNQSGPARKAV